MFELQGKSYLSVRQRPENKLHLQDGLWPNAQPNTLIVPKGLPSNKARTLKLRGAVKPELIKRFPLDSSHQIFGVTQKGEKRGAQLTTA